MVNQSQLLTAEELYDMGSESRWLELHRGIPYRVSPSGARHGVLATDLAFELNNFVEPRGLGRVLVIVGFVVCRNPDSVLGPDVAFITPDQVPARENRDFYVEGTPAFAVEIVSPTSSEEESRYKIEEYMEAGTKEACLIDSSAWEVTVFRPGMLPKTHGRSERVYCEGALKGFSVALEDFEQ